jgi:hypothetical protein
MEPLYFGCSFRRPTCIPNQLSWLSNKKDVVVVVVDDDDDYDDDDSNTTAKKPVTETAEEYKENT